MSSPNELYMYVHCDLRIKTLQACYTTLGEFPAWVFVASYFHGKKWYSLFCVLQMIYQLCIINLETLFNYSHTLKKETYYHEYHPCIYNLIKNSLNLGAHWQGLILILAWKSNHMPSKVWLNYFSIHKRQVEVWGWISNFIPHFSGPVITNPGWY